jgi:hypothetical protein
LSEPAFDELLRRLAAAEVEFVVVGGLALNAWGVVRGTKDVDVVQGLDGVPSYEDLRSRATEAEILGTTVAICSVDDLKAMKQAAGRTRDLADLEDLVAASDRGPRTAGGRKAHRRSPFHPPSSVAAPPAIVLRSQFVTSKISRLPSSAGI